MCHVLPKPAATASFCALRPATRASTGKKPGDSWNARTREKFLRFLREKASRFYAFALRIGRNRHDTGSRTMLIAIDSSRGLSPSQTIGGVPKKRGRQAPFDSAVPPPPTQ